APHPAPIIGNVVTVSFYFDGFSYAFAAHINRYESEGRTGPLLTVNMPTTMSTAESRRVYRLPADEEVPVTVIAKFRGSRLKGDLVDISRYGLRFRCPRLSPRAVRGIDVELTLQWDGDPVTINGRIAGVFEGEECAIALMDETEIKESGFLNILSRQERVELRRRKEEEAAAEAKRKEFESAS
ncbi:MAG: PilZ domain-containing protein, partial [Myxococcota bacterium]